MMGSYISSSALVAKVSVGYLATKLLLSNLFIVIIRIADSSCTICETIVLVLFGIE
jgi:hypothetical protein